MTGTRRIATVLALTFGVLVGATVPAWASFADTVALPTVTVPTITVAAPATLSVSNTCTTTTTVEKRTVYTDPTTGVQTQTMYSWTSNSATSATNVNSYTSSTAAGPGAYETTTTTTSQNTMVAVTATWGASATRGLSGYLVNAHLNDGTVYPMAQLAPGVLSTSQSVDADNLAYLPRLSVTTLTSYNWTATTAPSRVLTC